MRIETKATIFENKEYYYCENCHHLTKLYVDAKLSISSNGQSLRIKEFNRHLANRLVVGCEKCGFKTVHIDKKMAKIVRDLNASGHPTLACCQGHPEDNDFQAYVMLGFSPWETRVPKENAEMHAKALYELALSYKRDIDKVFGSAFSSLTGGPRLGEFRVSIDQIPESPERDPRVLIEYLPTELPSNQDEFDQIVREMKLFHEGLQTIAANLPARRKLEYQEHISYDYDNSIPYVDVKF